LSYAHHEATKFYHIAQAFASILTIEAAASLSARVVCSRRRKSLIVT